MAGVVASTGFFTKAGNLAGAVSSVSSMGRSRVPSQLIGQLPRMAQRKRHAGTLADLARQIPFFSTDFDGRRGRHRRNRSR
jgi:hypothetical protein